MRKRGQTAEQEATDPSLVARATAGDLAAFGELYRRHVDAAWRVALAVTTNPDDAADAVSDAFTRVFQALPERLYAADHFLPYLLAAVRNAAIDVLRRGGRQLPGEAAEDREWPALTSGPVDFLLADEDASMVARAFRSLPERWRSVLWLTEVEQIPARDAAMLLGVSPNGVAQLAVRARAGLRERYLQAHLRQNDVRLGCRHTVDRLGAYAAGGLAPRDVAKVDQHLAGCDPCRARLSDLQDLAPSLRRSVLPLPAGLAALALAKWELASSSTAASASVAITSAASAPVGAGTAGAAGTAAPVAGAAGTAAPVAGAGVGAVTASSSLVASIASAALLMAGVVGAGAIADRRSADRPPTDTAAPAASASTSTSGAGVRASADAAAGAGGADAAAAVDLAALAGQLGGLPDQLQRLVGTDLEALGKGRVKVATDTAVVDVDLADQQQPCRDIRVLGIPVACAPPPGGGTVPPADAVVSAVEATGRAVEPPAGEPSGLDLPG